MGTLEIYNNDEGIVIEQINELNNNIKRIFETKQEMLKHLDSLKQTKELDAFELKVSEEFWADVINRLNK